MERHMRRRLDIGRSRIVSAERVDNDMRRRFGISWEMQGVKGVRLQRLANLRNGMTAVAGYLPEQLEWAAVTVNFSGQDEEFRDQVGHQLFQK